jgi:hypothetical protein
MQLTVSRAFTLCFRVVDPAGIPVLDPQVLRFSGTVVNLGGSAVTNPGSNICRVSLGNLPPRTFNITGTKP